MRKLIAVGVLIGGLLTWAGPASAITKSITGAFTGQGGTGDPLQLAASGVVLPYIQGGPNGLKALVEVASPVGLNCNSGTKGADPTCDSGPDIHLIFFANDCSRLVSVPLPETENDIAFVDPLNFTGAGVNGLVAIAGFRTPGTFLSPLENAIHTRVYEFNPTDGRSRILEPIIIDEAEFGSTTGHHSKLWSPLRTGATFYAPFEGIDPNSGLFLHTQITFICPRDTIEGGSSAPFGQTQTANGIAFPKEFTTLGFPQIDPPFWTFAATGPTSLNLTGAVYDVNENFLSDITFGCDCLNVDVPVNSLTKSGVTYSLDPQAKGGTYSEIFVTQKGTWSIDPVPSNLNPGSFTGYRDVFSANSALNKFFGRLSNGSAAWIQGVKVSPFSGASTESR